MYTMIPFNRRHNVSRQMRNSLLDDRFFRSFFDVGDFFGAANGFRVDVKDKENAYELEAELPGVAEDQIDVTVNEDVLTISANVNEEKKEEKDSYVYSERRMGRMARSFSLEGIDQDKITAAYANGVLTLNLPKEEPQAPKSQRKIAVEKGKLSAPKDNEEK